MINIIIGVVAFLIAIFAFVWLLWRHETDPDKKHKPSDSEHLKCKRTRGA